MLEVGELRSGYGRLEILQGVTLQVAPGTIVGVIGPNGAGKSTLLKTIFGYLSPFGGRITLEDQSLIGLRPDQILRLGTGFVAQAGGLFADMTVHENLQLGGYGLPSRRQAAGSLSGGEQRALALARALVMRPKLLLLDEPSAALAPQFIDEVYATIQALNRSGLALLIVEQNVEMILSVAHRVFVLDLGRNAFDGTPAELRQTDRIRRLYLGDRQGAPRVD
ncbi:MAG: ABC transporter ATP-binding protein [Candidatus Rokuibacteriota bacterium]|nr:MAG: ABC transporter ATP-binding protein [Candidatus Rokubacteria bacterium]